LTPLVDNNISNNIKRNSSSKQWHRSRTCDVLSISQKVTSMAGAFNPIFRWMPYRRTTQMCADSYESIDTLLVAYYPYPLFFQHASADLAYLIVLWLTRNKFLQRL